LEFSLTEAVILAAARTPIATSFRGSLRHTVPEDLATLVVAESVRRAWVDPAAIDDVVLAESNYGGGDLARHAAYSAGMCSVPGQAVNRYCAGSLAAVQNAAASIRAGMDRIVVAGGVQSSSFVPKKSRRVAGTADEWIDPWSSPVDPAADDGIGPGMAITVGWNAARSAGLTREEMDRWAVRSHHRAVAAIDAGAFEDEIVAVDALQAGGTRLPFVRDEHPRRDTTLERLASLKPLHPEITGFSITAGNSSGVNDAAVALVIANGRVAQASSTPALAIVRAWASVGCEPAETGLAVTDAIEKLLTRAGRRVSDVTLWEINEAFASVPMAACRKLGLDEDLVNVSGSGCSLGHPVAATGARMITTLCHELRRRGGAGIGVAAMCAAAGQASAMMVEVPAW
jgi:acetyl-CoA C-acetyltransferase